MIVCVFNQHFATPTDKKTIAFRINTCHPQKTSSLHHPSRHTPARHRTPHFDHLRHLYKHASTSPIVSKLSYLFLSLGSFPGLLVLCGLPGGLRLGLLLRDQASLFFLHAPHRSCTSVQRRQNLGMQENRSIRAWQVPSILDLDARTMVSRNREPNLYAKRASFCFRISCAAVWTGSRNRCKARRCRTKKHVQALQVTLGCASGVLEAHAMTPDRSDAKQQTLKLRFQHSRLPADVFSRRTRREACTL